MMPMIPVQLGLLDPLYRLFGWILGLLYGWLNNYGLVIILFTIAIRLILMPLGLRSQRGMLRQQMLQDEVNEIKRRYPKDNMKVQELTQELYKKNGISMMSGCLPSVLSLLVIWPILYIFRAPLRFIVGVDFQNIYNIAYSLTNRGLMTASELKNVAIMDIPVLQGLRSSGSALEHAVSNGWIQLSEVINTNFLGIDLAMKPSWNPAVWFGEDWRVQLPMVLLIVITMITYFFQMRITRRSTPRPPQTKEERKREKANPAKRGQTPDQGAGMMKSMNVVMPIVMLFTMFAMPSAMCLYWLFQNLMFIMQSLLGYHFYVKPIRRVYAEEQAGLNRSRADDEAAEKPSFWQKMTSKKGGKKNQ
ncbi:MAG: YidC/Oxa1 family membrane protein insertase [Saccharofermentanales bacterium]